MEGGRRDVGGGGGGSDSWRHRGGALRLSVRIFIPGYRRKGAHDVSPPSSETVLPLDSSLIWLPLLWLHRILRPATSRSFFFFFFPQWHWVGCATAEEERWLSCSVKDIRDDSLVCYNLRRHWRLQMKWQCLSASVSRWSLKPAFPPSELLPGSPMMDGGRSSRTFTPDRAAFANTWREEACYLGAYRTAAGLWGSDIGRKASITPDPSPRYTSYSFCSCSFSRRGWIRRGGEYICWRWALFRTHIWWDWEPELKPRMRVQGNFLMQTEPKWLYESICEVHRFKVFLQWRQENG